jgi:hypothetical protein
VDRARRRQLVEEITAMTSVTHTALTHPIISRYIRIWQMDPALRADISGGNDIDKARAIDPRRRRELVAELMGRRPEDLDKEESEAAKNTRQANSHLLLNPRRSAAAIRAHQKPRRVPADQALFHGETRVM